MLLQTDIGKPRIDIELCGTDANIPPINKVHIMDEDSFEEFILEWLYATKNNQYNKMQRIGGAGDKGRDVIAYYPDNSVDYYQCKHYNKPIGPNDFYVELGKLCYYTFCGEIKIPSNYYIVASNDIGHSLHDMLDNHELLKSNLIQNWEKKCKTKITSKQEIILEGELLEYVKKFDFSIIDTYPIAKIVNEHLDTVYGKIRFGGRNIDKPELLDVYDEIKEDEEEMEYIKALLEAYSEELNIKIDSVEMLKEYESFFNHMKRQRKDYFSAEAIRRFVRDTLTNAKHYDILKEEIYDGIIDVHEQDFENGYKRLLEDLKQAVRINTSRSLLDSKLNCIGSSERKGVCHMLVEDGKLRWVKKNE